ncbi:polysialyltransferase family glycosyltransferase, partial [Caminibacter mediatlanticus]
IGFVFTEYQQNILLALLLQMNHKLDILFIRNNIKINKKLTRYANKIIIFNDIPYSIKNVLKFIREYKRIKTVLSSKEINNFYSWSFESPIVRSIMVNFNIKNFYLLEDGIGSYVNRKIKDLNLREYLYILLMNKIIDILNFRIKKKLWKFIIGCSLYNECFPYIKKLNQKIIIDKNSFINAISVEKKVYLINNSSLFIQQPFVEMGILTNEEYINIHIEGLNKIKKLGIKNIYWKLHPRTDISEEKIRLKKINKAFNNFFNIEIIQDKLNIEELVLLNGKKNIKYFSYYSSSLYVIKKILDSEDDVSYIYNDYFFNKYYPYRKILYLFETLGIKGV